MAPKLDAKKQADIPPLIIELVKYLRQVGSVSDADRARWTAEKQRRIEELRKYANHQMQINLTSWKIEVGEAITLAAYPMPEESRIYWYIALAGNLLWAATCLLAPPAEVAAIAAKAAGEGGAMRAALDAEKHLVSDSLQTKILTSRASVLAAARQSRVIELMSFTGAAIGSDVFRQTFGNRDIGTASPEDGKNLVRNVVGIQRGELEKLYKEELGEWASQLDGIAMWDSLAGGQEPLDLYDERVWTLMFPRIDYDSGRFNAIRDSAQKKVQGILADYIFQWRKFKTDRMMPQYNQAYAQWAMGTLAIPSNTFVPHLNFNLD